MKILHIISGLDRGGAEIALLDIVENSNYNHHIINLGEETEFSKKFFSQDNKLWNFNSKNYLKLLINFFKILILIKKNNYLAFNFWMYNSCLFGSLLLLFLKKKKKVFWIFVASNLSKNLISLKSRISIFLIRTIFKKSYMKILACGNQVKKAHVNIGFLEEDIDIVHLGSKVPDKKKLNVENKNNTIIKISNIARFDPQKDHKNLLSAFNELKKKGILFKLYLAGRGVSIENIQFKKLLLNTDLILNEDIILLGQINNVYSFLESIDLNVLSSKGEGLPISLIESMSMGVPCVATNVGDVKHILLEFGWLVTPNDYKKLSKTIEIAIDEWRLKKLDWINRCYDSHNHIKLNFSNHKMIKNFENLWKNI